MPDKTIFLDESGFTGTDLLNPDQPFFSVASTDLADDVARDLIASSFSRFVGQEPKFSALWSRPRNRQGFLALADGVRQVHDQLFCYRIDKRFCTLTKLVDFLIEPVLHDSGYDFYKNGYARKFSNMFNFALKEFAPELVTPLLRVYHAFSRNPTPRGLFELQATLRIMARSCPDEVKTFLSMASTGADLFLQYHDPEIFDTSNEIQLTTVLSSIAHWRQRSQDDLIVVHDNSSNFFRQASTWRSLTKSEGPRQLHQIADGTEVEYPLRVKDTIAGDSKLHPAIQLCDLVAGFANKVARGTAHEREDKFLQKVLDAGMKEVTVAGIHEDHDFAEGPPAELDGPDIVDQITEFMRATR